MLWYDTDFCLQSFNVYKSGFLNRDAAVQLTSVDVNSRCYFAILTQRHRGAFSSSLESSGCWRREAKPRFTALIRRRDIRNHVDLHHHQQRHQQTTTSSSRAISGTAAAVSRHRRPGVDSPYKHRKQIMAAKKPAGLVGGGVRFL